MFRSRAKQLMLLGSLVLPVGLAVSALSQQGGAALALFAWVSLIVGLHFYGRSGRDPRPLTTPPDREET